MENNNKKSRALIITIGVLVVLVGIVFLIYKNQNIFGVKNSSKIAKIFSPLETSKNQKKELMRAGEDISRGDGVMISEYGDPNTVIKSNVNDFTIGFADNDMSFGDLGSISLLSRDGDGFWNSFSKFLGSDIGAMQCNDKKDNDGDGKTDKDDPECHIDGDINKEYIKDHYSEMNAPVSALYPQCSDKKDNDGDGKTDKDDPECHIKGDINKAYVPTHFSETMFPTYGQGEGVDLVAETINPTIAIKGSKTNFSSIIYNYGTEGTGQSFFVLFTVTKDKNKDSFKNGEDFEVGVLSPSLEAGISSAVSFEYNFQKEGTYYMRACSDKKESADGGMVEEFNEENNCGAWTTITVTNALPQAGLKTECSDDVDNDGDGKIDKLDPECHYDGDINKEYVPDHTSEKNAPRDPSNGLPQCMDLFDNDNDGKIDFEDPECHLDGDINKEYLKNHDSEKSAFYESADECLDIENYPITYTDDEAAQLDTLLRKFYLIAPTLFSAEDIAMVQRDMDEYENLSNQVTTLTQQCYSDFSKDSYKGPKTRYGNPWYKPEDRGSYLSNEDSLDGKCVPNPSSRYRRTAESCAAINKRVDCERDGSSNVESGCVWVKGDLVKDFEAILNIW